jgi:hypothetical protein
MFTLKSDRPPYPNTRRKSAVTELQNLTGIAAESKIPAFT